MLTILLTLLLVFTLPAELAAAPLQLPKTYNQQDNIPITDYLVSEKLDGIRARWTGSELLTRNGNVIHAPAWFTVNWPDEPLDGELWTKRSDFQRIASIVLSETPDARWREVRLMVFDLPASEVPFAQRVEQMEQIISEAESQTLKLIPQFSVTSQADFEQRLNDVTAAGGEGLMLHHRGARYRDGRSEFLLKAKRFEDDEARVIKHLPGKGKYAGMMGSLLVEGRSGLRFKIGSGFTDAERREPPPLGSWVTYKFYGKTKKGLPRFASFMHVRPEADRPQ